MRRFLLSSLSILALTACQTTEQAEPVSVEVQKNCASISQGKAKVVDGKCFAQVEVPNTYTTSQPIPASKRKAIASQNVNAGVSQTGLDASSEFVVETIPAEYDTVKEKVFIQNASTELISLPAQYETVTETVVVQPQSVEYETIPGKYEWVEGEIPGESIVYETMPAEYETYQETIVVQEASTELVTIPPTYETLPNGTAVVKTPASTTERVIPAVTKMETRRRVKTPAKTVEKIVQNEIREGKTRILVEPGQIVEKTIPAVTKQVTRRAVKTPARTVERVIPAGEREVERTVQKKPESYILRDPDGRIIKEFANADEFARYQVNPYKRVEANPVSTFSADVDTASYSFVRQFVKRGQRPPAGSVRVEEMVNYFDYGYDKPIDKTEPFKPSITIVPSPWNAETRLVHIGVQGYEAPSQSPLARPDMNLVFLIDVSGSMRPENKLPLLKKSFDPLIKQLRPQDTISIVTYAGSAAIALEPVSGDKKDEIRAAIVQLGAAGSTAGAAGIQTAYELAAKNFDPKGTNRVILATDGDFNVGLSGIEALKAFISDKRKSGIYLSVLGFGQGNLKDHRMQTLAQNGNGIAGYIDSLKEARKFFEQDMGKNMVPIADDLKLQVEFNPERVSEYRLIGYETRALKREDFNNDKVDAGDVGQGHAVTAIYEINPTGSNRHFVDPLRYGKEEAKRDTSFFNEFGFLKIRYKKPGEAKSKLLSTSISDRNRFDSLDIAPSSTRFAVAVAAYGLKLSGDSYMDGMDWNAVTDLALEAKGLDEFGHRAEFVELTRSAEGLYGYQQ